MILKLFIYMVLCSYSFSSIAQSLDFKSYIKKYNDLEVFQKAYFEKLRFKLAPNAVKTSLSYKLLVTDQFGDEWMFKGGQESSKDGAVAIYRLYNFVGVPTPEIHYKKLIVNGEEIEGTLQRYVPTRNGNSFFFSELSTKDHEYIAKNHALAWLSLNNHTHMKQFIYLKDPESGVSIMRIDNSINWYTLGNDVLNTFYYSPILIHAQNPGYFSFWNDFLVADVLKKNLKKGEIQNHGITEQDIAILKKREIQIDLNKLYAWVNLIKLIPDDYYSHFYHQAVKNNFLYAGNNSYISPWLHSAEYVANTDEKKFIKKIIQRKNDIQKDFSLFYQHLAKIKDQSIHLDNNATALIFNELNIRLEDEIKSAKEKLKKTESDKISSQEEIINSTSLKTHSIIKMTMRMAFTNDTSARIQIIDQILNKLISQRDSTNYELEKKSISVAIKNFEELKKSQLIKTGTKEEIVSSMINYYKFFNE